MIRIYLLRGITIIIASIFLYKLLDLQVTTQAIKPFENNAVLEIAEYPERGFIYDRNGKLLVANQPAYDVWLYQKTSRLSIPWHFAILLAWVKKVDLQPKKARRYSKRLPSVVVNQISKETYAKLQEQMWKFKGFFIQKKSLREYRIDHSANVLGYVSEVNNNDLKRDEYYRLGEIIGRQGVEKSYEKQLRGVKGKRFLQKDRFNRIIGPYKEGSYDVTPIPAKNIQLTLDAELQAYGEELMRNKRGGIVAIEPATGEVLALVNAPSYDPSILVGRKRTRNYRKLANDTLAKPLFDRGLLAQYPQDHHLNPQCVNCFTRRGYYATNQIPL